MTLICKFRKVLYVTGGDGMFTIDILKEFGANTEEGLARCLNNEEFYLKMVDIGIADERFEIIKDALDKKDLDAAFEMAHALKGVLGNLSLTPIQTPMEEMTELLRARTDMDYSGLYAQVKGERDRLLALG